MFSERLELWPNGKPVLSSIGEPVETAMIPYLRLGAAEVNGLMLDPEATMPEYIVNIPPDCLFDAMGNLLPDDETRVVISGNWTKAPDPDIGLLRDAAVAYRGLVGEVDDTAEGLRQYYNL